MPVARYTSPEIGFPMLGLVQGDQLIDWATYGNYRTIRELYMLTNAELEAEVAKVSQGEGRPLSEFQLLAPLDYQEVWASGVTYLRSRDARMEESTTEDVYERVYAAERPELFFKATPNRVVGPNDEIAIRGDSQWDVPEPELALAVNVHGEIMGYTIGNDMSSRTIEGENPLYLPQAKLYSKCAGLGPWLTLPSELADPGNLKIDLTIERAGATHFRGETSTEQIQRTFADLVDYLLRHNEFAHGVVLMTGTGIVPPAEFTLEAGDVVHIDIEGIGRLSNSVIRL